MKIVKCHDCKKLIPQDEAYVEIICGKEDSYHVCEDCADNYGECEACGELCVDDMLAYSGSALICDACADEITGYTKHGNPIF